MTGRRWFAVALALGAALALPPGAGAQTPAQDSLTGSGPNFNVSITSGPSGENPTGSLTADFSGAHFQTTSISCLLVDANTATFAAPVEPNVLGVTFIKVTFVDNGPGPGVDTFAASGNTVPYDNPDPMHAGRMAELRGLQERGGLRELRSHQRPKPARWGVTAPQNRGLRRDWAAESTSFNRGRPSGRDRGLTALIERCDGLSRNGSIAFTSFMSERDEDDLLEYRADRIGTPAASAMTSSPASSSIASTGERSQALAVRRERRFASLGDHRARAIRRDDGSELTRLTSTYDSNPTWAPSAQRLAFTRRVGGDFHRAIYTIRRDGTGPKRLVRRGYNPSWSVRGTIAYETADGEIWATGPRGKRRWRLAGPGRCPHCGGAGGSNDPDWSPTGDKLVFERQWWRPRLATKRPDSRPSWP